jgi:peptide/nickel transport system substrate-binding protein
VATVLAVALTTAACGDKPQSATGGTYTSVDAFHPINVSAPINPYNNQSNAYQGYNAMRLAWPKNNLTDMNAFYPAIAASWDLSADGNQVTVHLQPTAKWSDGTPVTSKDVLTSAAVAFTQGSSVFSLIVGTAGALQEVKATDDKTVVFTQTAVARNNTFLNNLLQMWVLPDAAYGSQLPANFWDLVKTGGSADAAQAGAAKAARDQITALGKKLIAYGPAKDLSCGPFTLQSVNPGEADLVKNKYFYAADKIGPDKLKLRNYTGNEQIWSYLQSGELDSAPYTSLTAEVSAQIMKTAGTQRITGLSQVSAALAFNESYAPFDKVQVRQAIAYLIDRQQVQKIGEPDSGKMAAHTTGLIEDAAAKWLGQSAVDGLNPYSVDKAKADSLLTQAGLTKSNGKWMLPGGKPFTMTIQTVAGFSDWIAAGKNIASQLTDFGIDAQAQTTADFATYQSEMAAGKYPVGFWLIALGPSTYNAYARIYGAANGWLAFGGQLSHKPAKTGGNWIGSPETADVPGLGPVNPGQLTYQLSQLPLDQQKDTVLKLAQYTNAQLPVIQIWNQLQVLYANNTRFTNFPPSDCECLRQQPGVWMALGYIRKK